MNYHVHEIQQYLYGVIFDLLILGRVFGPPLLFSEITRDIAIRLYLIVLKLIGFLNITMTIARSRVLLLGNQKQRIICNILPS